MNKQDKEYQAFLTWMYEYDHLTDEEEDYIESLRLRYYEQSAGDL